jgi:AcrR family transcriptional regulator
VENRKIVSRREAIVEPSLTAEKTPSGRVGPRSYLPSSERKRHLLDHGVAAIREFGWEKLTIARLAKRAGVSRQLVYQYFGTLEQLFLELTERFQDEVYEAAVSSIARHPDDFAAAMRTTLETLLIGLREEQLAYSDLLAGHWPHPQLPPPLKKVRASHRRRIIDIWAEYYERVNGLAPRDAHALSSFQHDGLHGLLALVNTGQLSAEEAIDFFVDVVAAAIERLGGRVSTSEPVPGGRTS